MSQTTPAAPRAQPPQDTALVQALQRPYQHGFVTDIETDSLPPGLDEDTIRAISRKKHEPDFLLQWRLAAFARWRGMAASAWLPRAMKGARCMRPMAMPGPPVGWVLRSPAPGRAPPMR